MSSIPNYGASERPSIASVLGGHSVVPVHQQTESSNINVGVTTTSPTKELYRRSSEDAGKEGAADQTRKLPDEEAQNRLSRDDSSLASNGSSVKDCTAAPQSITPKVSSSLDPSKLSSASSNVSMPGEVDVGLGVGTDHNGVVPRPISSNRAGGIAPSTGSLETVTPVPQLKYLDIASIRPGYSRHSSCASSVPSESTRLTSEGDSNTALLDSHIHNHLARSRTRPVDRSAQELDLPQFHSHHHPNVQGQGQDGSRFTLPHLPIPTHLYLPTPVSPIIHLCLLLAHLMISAVIPFLLVKWYIQPLVLWIVAVVTLALQCVYLLPVITLEVIGLIRGRPVDSAWLQSGIHLVIMALALLPHGFTVFILISADQLPNCSSALVYKKPKVVNWESHTRWSTCEMLPTVTILGILNLIILLLEVMMAVSAVQVDYIIQRKEERRLLKLFAPLESDSNSTNDGKQPPDNETGTGEDEDEDEERQKKGRRSTWWREKPDIKSDAMKKVKAKRWTTGPGRLLWDIEGFVHRRRAQRAEERAE